MKKPHIGFVGLGAMGLPMLVNILKHHNAGGAGGQVQSTSSVAMVVAPQLVVTWSPSLSETTPREKNWRKTRM